MLKLPAMRGRLQMLAARSRRLDDLFEASGLGLAIAQQLTATIGGQMRLYNRAGGGLAAEIVIR
ncbi:hypothetical protein HGP14_08505 [Rhizobium sp. P32RR-XVIII]|uniref:hypothetical protein n=1 Tax=Rhizobium sp. P32RR-XVIII TaxID=2726738 RepID=UPI0014564AE0|nr:hypothetical protein [Rhizobium sp. P32RR-XVIII]NLS03410.1 hypothetical protein [Rhizobium sp. P32RR-XVIII]